MNNPQQNRRSELGQMRPRIQIDQKGPVNIIVPTLLNPVQRDDHLIPQIVIIHHVKQNRTILLLRSRLRLRRGIIILVASGHKNRHKYCQQQKSHAATGTKHSKRKHLVQSN